MRIVCEASGDPKPDVRIIDPDGKRLAGNEFKLEKFGTYKCQASSRLGNDSLNITVSEAKGILKFTTQLHTYNKSACTPYNFVII